MTKPPRETDDEERHRVQQERWNLPEIIEYRELIFYNIAKAWEIHPSPVLQENDHRNVLALMRADMDSKSQLVRHQALAQGKPMCGVKTIIWLVGDEFWRQIVDDDGRLPMDPPKNTQPYDVKYRQMNFGAENECSNELKKLEMEFERMEAAKRSETDPASLNKAEGESQVVTNREFPLTSSEDLVQGWHALLGTEKPIPWGGPFTIAVPRNKFNGQAGSIEQPKHLNNAIKLYAQEHSIEEGPDFWVIGVSFADAMSADSLDHSKMCNVMIAFDGLLVWCIRHVICGGSGGLETLRTSVEDRCEKFRNSYDRDRMVAIVAEHLAHLNRSMRYEFALAAAKDVHHHMMSMA